MPAVRDSRSGGVHVRLDTISTQGSTLSMCVEEAEMEGRRLAVVTFVRRFLGTGLCVLGCLLLAGPRVGQAVAVDRVPGYAATDFATGFVNVGGIGPIGVAFDPSGNLFVGNYTTGFLYKFGPAGGVASAATQVNTTAIGGQPAGLSFTRDGHQIGRAHV